MYLVFFVLSIAVVDKFKFWCPTHPLRIGRERLNGASIVDTQVVAYAATLSATIPVAHT
jgi:hypothetical protein